MGKKRFSRKEFLKLREEVLADRGSEFYFYSEEELGHPNDRTVYGFYGGLLNFAVKAETERKGGLIRIYFAGEKCGERVTAPRAMMGVVNYYMDKFPLYLICMGPHNEAEKMYFGGSEGPILAPNLMCYVFGARQPEKNNKLSLGNGGDDDGGDCGSGYGDLYDEEDW